MKHPIRLSQEFYTREDVVQIAQQLLGKVLCTNFEGRYTSGIISETEAYAGVTDKASHAWNGRRTNRTEVMYMIGGTAYVYLCYGIHSLFNVVTSVTGNPHAVLIRGIIPFEGKEYMAYRTGKSFIGLKEGKGPGNVSRLLGIHYSHSGLPLVSDYLEPNQDLFVWIEDRGIQIPVNEIITGRRIGVDYAGDDALLPYRFVMKEGNIENMVEKS